ncbi:hypothetical protein C8Q75DRAFT_803028 [Abortiporus biennis]|nr:hypothetical protein C8Q75DRAFT_803028 [Abortiporus biennis]
MRRGLGPKRPKRLHNPKRHLWARHHGASPTVSALPTPTSTPDCTSYAGMIGTTFFSGTGELVTGFLSKSANVYGEYRFAQDVGDALLVSFCVPSNGNKPFDITTTNGISNFPYLAAVQGFASSGPDLPAGSSNYAYITGSSKTHPGVTPGTQSNALNHAAGTNLPAQSAIWTLNTNDNSLTANYVNSDKSTPTTTIELVPDSEAFIITGDPSAFNNEYGDANPTTFTFIPA